MPAPSVLVAFASLHHGTEEMAAAIAEVLRDAGFEVDLRAAADVLTVEPYGAVVVGSAIYMAQWEGPALELVRRERLRLAERRVWLFSSGPVGDGKSTRHPETVPHPGGVNQLADEIGAQGRAMFGGRVDSRGGGFAMAIMARAGLEGDWRDLPRVRSWAMEIAAALRADG
ncbi:MAG TPA: flavodoxin domain-containing protein [Candidatus Limnocylindrales bacterium]